MTAREYAVIALLSWNLFVLILYGADKYKARHNKWRTRELTLILPAFFMGGAGAVFGMILFNHKTSKMKFRLLIPLAVILNIAAVWSYYTFL